MISFRQFREKRPTRGMLKATEERAKSKRIQIQIRRSLPLDYGSGSGSYTALSSVAFHMPTKRSFFVYFILYIYIRLQK
jgi:hypothetical protein